MKRFSLLAAFLFAGLALSRGALAYSGSVPAGVPGTFSFGAIDKFDDYGATPHKWKTTQGSTCWDYSYAYLVPGWPTWFGSGAPSQNWAGREITEWNNRGQAMVFTFYYSYGSTSWFQSTGNMNTYWSELAELFKQINTFGNTSKKTIVHFEPDGIGFWRQAGTSPTATGTVIVGGASAPPGWGGPTWNTTNFPNTLQGWSKAIKAMRDYYAPTKALLAHHYTHWANGADVFVNPSDSATVNTKVDDMTNYIQNIETLSGPFDFFFADPADRDADWWKSCQGDNSRWTNPSYTVSWGTRSWGTIGYIVDRVSQNLGRRGFMWQIPVGNTWYKTCNNSSAHYRDNHAQNFLPSSSTDGSSGTPGDAYSAADTSKGPGFWAGKGIIGVLFGEGYYEQAVPTGCGGTTHVTHLRDYPSDGITNGALTNPGSPGFVPAPQATSSSSDNEGGYIRNAVSKYCSTGKYPLPGAAAPSATPTRTPYLGTPTFTPTATVTPNYFSTLFYDGEAAASDAADDGTPGTYTYAYQGDSGATTTLSDQAGAKYSGTKGLQVHLQTASGGYAGAGWQRSPAAADPRTVDSSSYTAVEFMIKASVANAGVRIKFGSASGTPVESSAVVVAPYLVGGGTVGTTWALVSIPLSAFGLGPSGAAAWKATVGRLVVEADGMGNSFNYDVFIDDMVFITRPATPTVTRTMTFTPNPNSPTRTPTITPTPDTITRMIYDGESAPTDLIADGTPLQYVYNYPASATATFVDSSAGPVFGGAQSGVVHLAVASGGYAGVGWQFSPVTGDARTVDSSPFDALEFYIRGAAGAEAISVALGSDDGSQALGVSVAPYIVGGTSISTGWQRVIMPLSAFNVGLYGAAAWKTHLGRLIVSADGTSGAPTSFDYTVYLDDVQLTKRPSTPTPTITRTLTAAPSATRTQTQSATPSATRTATRTASPSATPSGTRSATPSASATPAANSPTLTGTPTPSALPTDSATATATRTASPSATRSSTRSATPSASPSPTDVPPGSSATPTPTLSPTFSASPSGTRSASPSPSASSSPSQTAGPSPSGTPSVTPSATRTASPVDTASPTFTPSVTASPSATMSFTAVPPGSSETATPTASPSVTASPAATATATATASPGVTAPPTASPSATPSALPSATATPSVTPSNTSVVPPPSSPTATVTQAAAAPTAVPDGPLEIEEHAAFPNPVVGTGGLGGARIVVKLRGSAEKLTLKLYSRAMTCLGTYESGPLAPGWQRLPLPQAFMDQAGNGTYFYIVSGERKGSKTVKDAIGRLTILR